MMNKYDFAESVGMMHEYFIEESMKGSAQMKERIITKWSTLAASVCLFLAAGLFAWHLSHGNVTPQPIDSIVETTVYGTGDVTEQDTAEETLVNTDDTTVSDEDTTSPADTEPPDEEIVTAPPSVIEGGVEEFKVDKDVIDEFAVALDRESGAYIDGMHAFSEIYPETYSDRTVLATSYLLDFEVEGDTIVGQTKSGNNYVLRYYLDTKEVELVETFKEEDWETIRKKYGIILESYAGTGYEYHEFGESGKYLLYREDGTRNLKLYDKAKDKTITLHDWNGYGHPAAIFGRIWADRYVFYTLVDPDPAGPPDDHVSFKDMKYEHFVYDIETGTERRCFEGYFFFELSADILYLYTEEMENDENVTRQYYSVDLSAGIDSAVREEAFLNSLRYTFNAMFSEDGRYITYYNYFDDHHNLTFRSYDRETGREKTALLSNTWEYRFDLPLRMPNSENVLAGYLSIENMGYSEGIFVVYDYAKE